MFIFFIEINVSNYIILTIMSSKEISPGEEKNHYSKSKAKKVPKDRKEQNIEKQKKQSKITNFFEKRSHAKKQKPLNPDQKLLQKLKKQYAMLQEKEKCLLAEQEKIKEGEIKRRAVFTSYMKKSRSLVAQSLSDIYQIRREDKKVFNPALGYYNAKEGVVFAGYKISDRNQRIKYLKKLLASEKNNTETFQKEIIQSQLEKQEEQIKFEKQKLKKHEKDQKLVFQESSCKFSKNWPILNQKYVVLQLIGIGGFSEVYRGYNLEKNQFVALKLNSFQKVSSQTPNAIQFMNHLNREYDTHRGLSHENIARVYEIVETGNSFCIVLQYCDGPELSSYLETRQTIPQKHAKEIIHQILKALNYLFHLPQKVIHYDLKPHNLMFHDGKIKILDFGLCKLVDDDDHSKIALTRKGVGTYWYLPPQSFEKDPLISSKVDIWSTGVIFYEILYGRKPFGDKMSQKSVLNKGVILNAYEVPFPQNSTINVSQEAKNFIKSCLKYNPNERLNPAEALKHPYFAQQSNKSNIIAKMI